MVTSLSVDGLSFTTQEPLTLRLEAVYDVVLFLHEQDGSILMDEIAIRWREGTRVKAEFHPPDTDHQVLEFYLDAAGGPC